MKAPLRRATGEQTGGNTNAGGQRAFLRQHPANLATGQAEVTEHAELAPPGRRQRGETGRDTSQADDDGDRFEQVGDGEGAVENTQAERPDLSRPSDFQHARAGQGGQRRSHPAGIGIRCQIDRCIIDQTVAGQAAVVGQVDHDGAGLPRIVAPDTRDMQIDQLPGERQRHRLADPPAVQVEHRFGYPDRRSGPGLRPADQRQIAAVGG